MGALVDQCWHQLWGFLVRGSAKMGDDRSVRGQFLVVGIVPAGTDQDVQNTFAQAFANVEWRVVRCKTGGYNLVVRPQFVQNDSKRVYMDFTYNNEAVFTNDVELHHNRAERCLLLIVLAMQAELRRQIEATAVGGLVSTQRFLQFGLLPETEKDIEFRLYATETDVRELARYLETY